MTLAFFVCPTCGLRGPEYREPAKTGDDLGDHYLFQTPLVETVNNAMQVLTRAKNEGYLTRGDYPRGEVSEAVVDCLVRLVRRPLVHWLGWHDCDLDPCRLKQPRPELRYKGTRIPSHCCTDILVPDKATAYVAPALIVHYILFHQYLPPTGFLEAVLARPDPGSSEYLDAIDRIYLECVEGKECLCDVGPHRSKPNRGESRRGKTSAGRASAGRILLERNSLKPSLWV